MMRMARACATLMLCLALGACGDRSDSAVAPPKADAGTGSGLGAKRFVALDAVFATAVALDKYQDQTDVSSEQLREDSTSLLKACRALSEDDALMRAVRGGCPQINEFAAQAATIGTCDGNAACLRSSSRALRAFVKRLVAVSRDTDRAVAAEQQLAHECKQALTTPSQAYAVFEGYDSAMLQMQHALRARSVAALDRARERLAAADKQSKMLPSSELLLERFRSGCA
jgi:hypothetical protein